MKKTTIASILAAAYLGLAAPQSLLANEAVEVTLDNFVQAESTLYFNKNAQENNVPINEISHQRVMANIDVQDIIRMNQD
ncbi:MAG: carboxylesterase, partial [Gammaproteobacteria bacterium]|nr:carboxylesterase [Gammaproteobacteria bacterium]